MADTTYAKTMTVETHDATVADGIVLIDFWAGWCGPCLKFAPVFESMAEANQDITFAKVDTENQQELSSRYGVRSIPTLVIYRDGIPIFSQPGAIPEPVLADLIGKVRDLDMEMVRAEYEKQLAEANKS